MAFLDLPAHLGQKLWNRSLSCPKRIEDLERSPSLGLCHASCVLSRTCTRNSILSDISNEKSAPINEHITHRGTCHTGDLLCTVGENRSARVMGVTRVLAFVLKELHWSQALDTLRLTALCDEFMPS